MLVHPEDRWPQPLCYALCRYLTAASSSTVADLVRRSRQVQGVRSARRWDMTVVKAVDAAPADEVRNTAWLEHCYPAS